MASVTRVMLVHRLLARSMLRRTVIMFSGASASTQNDQTLFSKNDDFMKKYADQASKAPNEPKPGHDVWEDATIVKTTGVLGKDEDSKLKARLGVFWGPKDEMNVYKEVEPIQGAVVSLPLAELESVNMALRQAVYERGLNRLIVQTDSEFVVKCVDRWLTAWRNNGYMKRDGTPVKNRAYLEELDRLLGMIEVKVVLSHHKTRYDNDVISALRHNEEFASKIDADAPIFSFANHIQAPPTDKPTIYTSGTIRDTSTKNKIFVLAGYGIHWPDNPENDKSGRFAKFPVTVFRAQLYAIIEALKMAKEQGLKDVCIVTDSDRFLRFHNLQWIKKDGTPVANYPLYREILGHMKDINVSFLYMPSKFNNHIEQALLLAEDGLAYPIEN